MSPRRPVRRPSPAVARRRQAVFLLAVVLVVGLVVRLGQSLLGGSGPVRSSAAPAGRLSTAPEGVYAHARAGMLSPTVAADPYRLYVPESAGTGIDVIDPSADRVVARYATGLDPQHVVPSYDLRTLYVTNDLANTLTPVDPATGRISGPNIPVDDPYNLYFAPGGRQALVMAETRERIDFYDLPGFHIAKRLHLSCPGLNHADFSADGSFMVVSCEFGARLVKVDLKTETAVGYLSLRGSSPQDVRLDDTGRTFWVADMNHAGVHLIDAATFRQVAFIPTGRDATGSTPAATAPTCTSPTAAPEASA